MTGRRPRRLPVLRAAVLAAVAAVAVLVAAPVAAHGSAPAADGRAAAAATATPFTVTIDALSPVSASNGATLTLTGSIHDTSGASLSGLRLVVGVGSVPQSREAYVRDLAHPPGIVRVLDECSSCLQPTSLTAGTTGRYQVAIPLGDQLDRGVVSVYPLAVRVVGADGGSLGEADTFLPYVQQQVASPLRVAWLVPLDGAPVQGADGAIDTAGFPASVGPDGRLGELLAQSTPPPGTRAVGDQPGFAPVTYAVQPDILDAVAQTAHDGWRRTGDSSTTSGRPADAASAAFLAALTAQTSGRSVLALPYADPDAVALTRAGLALDLSTAVATGRSDVAARLPAAQVLQGDGWATGTAVDQQTLDTYAAAGITTLVLPGGQLPVPASAFPSTQTAVTTLQTVGPTVRGLALDPDVEDLLGAAGRDAPTPAMSAQRLLALLALEVGEAPNDDTSRDVVLALPRGSSPVAGWLASVLTDTGSVPWLQAVSLSDTQDDPGGDREPLAPYPASARAAELPQEGLTGGTDSVIGIHADIAALASVLPDTAITRPLDLALTRAESVAWRGEPAGAAALRDGIASRTATMLGQVRLAAATTVTLGSQHASIPVTVDNGLAEPATVAVTLLSNDRTKLSTTRTVVTVGPGRKVRVSLPADTQRAGTFRAAITLATPSGRQLSRTAVTVHSRAYGAITIGITLGALAVLLLAIGVRAVRRLRDRRRPGAGAA